MKRMRRSITALVAICALGAVPTASASATEPHWYVGGTKLAENTPTTITGAGAGALLVTIATININITCNSLMSSAGAILNPTGGGMGTGSGITLIFSGCTVDAEGQHCSVRGVTVADPVGKITTAALTATAEPFTQVTFSPTPPATKFVELELSGCATAGLNRKYPVTGTATGVESVAGSGTLVFNSTTGSALKLGGIAATFYSTTELTAGGSAVTIHEP